MEDLKGDPTERLNAGGDTPGAAAVLREVGLQMRLGQSRIRKPPV